MAFLIDGAVGIVTDLGKCVFKQIGHHLGYIVFYNRNKKELKEQLEILKNTKTDVDRKVENAKSKGYAIFKEVSEWLADVDDEKKKHDELSNSNPSCFNFLQRHQLSRKAKKMATDICELKDRGKNFGQVGCPAPLSDTKNTIVPEGYQILQSKITMAKKIKDALAKPEVKKVGIYGMGGVGKTYLLNEVKKLVLKGEDKLFDLVIDVKVGQSNDVMNMQQQIGDFLNITVPSSLEGRASFLRNALENMKGNILITFDDLWDEFDLIKDVGIPLSKEGCKILMTSRFQNIIANKMNIKECFEVTCLDDKESWNFFVKIIGDMFDTTNMENIAREVVEECGGLPLALDIIANTLKGKDINYWEGALMKLKNSIPVNIKDVGENVYASLKLSYEYLDGEEAKSLFLLCGVFPDDRVISVKDLQMYVMGMRLLKMVNTWKEARRETHNLVEDLTSSSLLQRVENKCVRMHDIVRDVAIYIGPEFNMSTLYYGYSTSSKVLDEEKCGSYRAIAVDCKDFWNLIPNMKFPKLELLILRFANARRFLNEKVDNYVDVYFEGMGNLKVLDMRGTSFLQPLWTSLKNLRTLCMSNCKCKDINTIGHLKELEILSIRYCKDITELPTSISELKQLKVLEVSHCNALVVIRPNIISSMTKLEELVIYYFTEWGEKVRYKNTWIQNAQLSELNCLSHLSILRVCVLLKPKIILLESLSSQNLKNLREFFIYVGTTWRRMVTDNFFSTSDKYEKFMYLDMKSQIGSVNGTNINILLEGTEKLMIKNDFKGFVNDIFEPIGKGYPLLKYLIIEENSDTRHLRGNDFTSLKWLILRRMMTLESIVPRHAPTNPFNKLKVIQIQSCKQLRNLFSFTIFKGLSNLREINILGCDMMDEIVSVEIEDHTTIFSSPLASLALGGVKKLTSFCSTKPSIQQTIVPFFDQRQVSFPQLEYLSIYGADILEMLWHNNGSSFSKLQTIQISDCNKLRCVFPSNIVTSLVFLDTLIIQYCELLEMVFEIEKRTTSSDTKVVPLRHLSLINLPQLKYVWNKDVGDVLAFPNLKNVDVNGCPKLKSIFPVSYTKYMKEIEELKVLDGASKLKEVVLLQSLVDLKVRGCHSMINLFSASVAKNLVNLSSIEIYNCREMTSIVAAEAEEEEENGEIVFNKLFFIKLASLAKVECFYSGKCTMEFPILNELSIERCDDMKIFSYGVTNTPTLEYINIGENKLAILPTQGINDIIHAFFTFEIGRLQGMRKLELSLKSAKRSFWRHKPESFSELKELTLVGCEDDNIVFLPLEMREVLYNIEKLKIKNAHQLVQVFENEELSGNNNNDVQRCAKLKTLELWNLSNLRHVWQESSEEVIKMSFDSLEMISVDICENLKCLLPSTVTFQNLKHLEIRNCNEMMSLFRSSVAQNLGNLESIEVDNCTEMRCIVVEEEEANGEIVFKHLNNLSLKKLPRLVGFHTGKCMIKFPSLETLCIDNCNEMETFSVGVLSYPKLKSMKIGSSEFQISPGQDINGIIRTHLQIIQQKKKGKRVEQ